MPKAIIKTKYFKSVTHVLNHAAYIHRQSPIFTLDGNTGIDAALEEIRINSHSQFWRQVYSLQEEDCKRLEVDRDYFQALVVSKKSEIAKAYNISPENLRVVASFHDKDYHPHIHMIIYSTNQREGFLRVHNDADRNKVLNKASKTIKSIFTNEIFKDDLHEIKNVKSQMRNKLNEQVRKELQAIAKPGYVVDRTIIKELQQLGTEINKHSGKKVYGYMPSAVKEKIDAVLKHILSTDETAAKFFSEYGRSQHELLKSYADSPETLARKMEEWEQAFFSPKKGEDTTRHNMVIKAALHMENSNRKSTTLRENNSYTEKSPTGTAQSLLYRLGQSLAQSTGRNHGQQNNYTPNMRSKRLRKVTHRQNSNENTYEP